ncbi:acyltransferase family protein [Actinoplanes sp. RD1]|uniref:acyltransferase family protein n=1 Tax=Actinoplanes sp. RD1 TaxID=3064538 RepID=UPI002741BCFB|nr:acyltransferase family protein [Actinoplanes sp. RD1]
MTHRSLNAIRAVAAVLVVVYHLRTLLMQPGDGFLYALTGLGPAAVLVFFVLSGYWVGGSVLNAFRRGTFTWSRYLSARLGRLWIVLIPAVLLTAVLDHLGLALLGHTSIYAGDAAYHDTVPASDLAGRLDPLTALGNVTFLQTMVVHTYGTNASLWSLAYEAVYYAVLPLALSTWRGKTSTRVVCAAVLVAVLLLAGPKVLMYLPVWLLGAAASQFKGRVPQTTAARATALALVAGAMYLTYAHYSSINVLVLAGATTALVMTLATDIRRDSRILDGLSRYAESSYSLYAIHLPIAALIAAILTPDVNARWAPTPGHWLALAALTAGLTVAGWAFAQVTERHTDRLRPVLTMILHGPREKSAA